MYELITLNNQFLSLDVLDEENEIKKLTGFSGSNATLLKGKEKSYLFTDNRYALQAKKEIKDKSIEIVFMSFRRWCIETDFNEKISYNPWCHSIDEVKHFGKNFIAKAKEPSYMMDTCPFEYEVQFAGDIASNKVGAILEFMAERNLDAYIITDPTDVSWLLNLRSCVLPYSPVYRAFALVDKKGFVQVFKHPKEIKKYKTVGLNDIKTPAVFLKYIKDFKAPQLPKKLRLKKTEMEQRGFREAHIKDGIAITKLLYWLYNTKTKKTEMDVANKLYKLRCEQDGFYKESFGSIVAMGKNSALPHYQPTDKKNDKITKDMLLIDVGAHYFGGTTDMTRTIHLGKPTSEQIKHNTLVLKGHINLATQKFLEGTTGAQLDMLARSPMLNEELDYGHSTGHGVGNFLSVHEAPSISKTSEFGFFDGIVTSIEPAVYFEDKYGIRIENLYATRKELSGFIKFENLTFVPFDNSLINLEMLNAKEKKFVFEYQKNVYNKLEPHLKDKESEWLFKYVSFNNINSIV